MEVEGALRAIRAGALHVPECLNSGNAQELAGVLQVGSMSNSGVQQHGTA